MTAYHQMGHHSQGLNREPVSNDYAGAILSPVNSSQDDMPRVTGDRPSDEFEFIFDPQLYYPTADRGHLPGWAYFPDDVDTADLSDHQWWGSLNQAIADCLPEFKADAVCSPARVPRVYSNDYFATMRDTAIDLKQKTAGSNIDVLQTLLVQMRDLADSSRAAEIASIATDSPLDRVYLTFITDVPPRQEYNQTDDIVGLWPSFDTLKTPECE